MEALILLLVVAALAAPIVAIILAVQANSKIRELRYRIDELERGGGQSAPPPVQPHVAPAAQPPPMPYVAPEPATSPVPATPPEASAPATFDTGVSSLPPPVLEPAPAFSESPPPLPPAEPSAPLPPATPSRKPINWEQFMGVKLAAWLGGVALFFALAFLIKYSFEHDLVPPSVRVGLGFVAGLALVVGGIQLTGRNYEATGQTLSATGFVTLYAITFSAHSIYHFPAFNTIVSMVIMVLITAGAFTLASVQRAHVIAILGLLGGFLTPVLLSTGQDNAIGLFLYIAMLDIGLLAIAARRDWTYLVALGAIGTALLQFAWYEVHFVPSKLGTLVAVCCGFVALFGAGHAWLARMKVRRDLLPWAAIIPSLVGLILAIPLVTEPTTALRPQLVLTLVLVADIGALAALIHGVKHSRLHPIAGLAIFYVLGLWLSEGNAESMPGWAIAAILVFAALHSSTPMLRSRLGHEEPELPWAGIFPLAGLIALLPVVFGGSTTTLLVWPATGALVVIALVRALTSRSLVPLALVLVGCLVVLGAAITRIAPDVDDPMLELVLVVVMGGGLVAAALMVMKVIRKDGADSVPVPGWAEHMPEVSATAPFVLLVMLVMRMRPESVAPLFLAALALAVLLLWLALRQGRGGSCVSAVLGVLMVEHALHFGRSLGVDPGERLVWHLGFALLFLAYLLVFRARALPMQGAVAAAAVAIPGHLFLIVNTAGLTFPAIEPGIVAVALALPVLGVLLAVARAVSVETPWRMNRLAWLGAAVLFCITVAIPIQWSRQWMTLGWALEGAALIALFRKLPHPGLRIGGVVILCVVFVRLALNEQVLEYGVRGEWPIWNWILAVYGTASLACFAGAALMRPPEARTLGVPARPLLATLGTILAFLLLNLQIADYFTPWGGPLEFSFSGSFARDMAYTIGWAVFALAMLIVGIAMRTRAARFAALALLGVALLKLFFHDLAELNQLYRIGALVAVAAVAIVSSWLYQRFLRADTLQPE
jgi:uncharacterized membrane protein